MPARRRKDATLSLYEILRKLEFTDYESKVYLALTNLLGETFTAERVSELSRVPRPKVYQILARFQNEYGILDRIAGRPARFVLPDPILSIDTLLDNRVREFEREMRGLKRRASGIIGELVKKDGAGDEIRDGSQGLLKVIGKSGIDAGKFPRVRASTARMLGRAKEEVCIMTGSFGWARQLFRAFTDTFQRGVRVRALMRRESDVSGGVIGELRTRGAGLLEIKHYDPGNMRMSIIDRGKEAMIVVWNNPAPVESDEENDPSVAAYTDNDHLGKGLYASFLYYWDRAS